MNEEKELPQFSDKEVSEAQYLISCYKKVTRLFENECAKLRDAAVVLAAASRLPPEKENA